MANAIQQRVQALITTYLATGSKAAAMGAFVYPTSMTWSGSRGSFLSIAERNQPWRNTDPLENSAVMNCLAWIQRNFGQGHLRTVREQRDGSFKSVDVPGFLDLVYKPNDHHTAYSFWAGTLLSYHLDGNAYWIKVRNARGFGVPTELWYEPHWSLAPHYPQDGSVFIDYYERRVNGRIQQIPVENVIHFRNGVNPGNPRYGLAPLKVALLEVFTDQEAAAYTAALLKNMAIPGVVVSPKQAVGFSPEKIKDMKQTFMRKFGGDKRGEPLLLDFDATISTLGFSPKDMDFAAVRRIGEERISGCFGLPAIVAGLGAGLDASTYNNLKELKKSAFEDCLSPTWDDFAETLTNQLLPDFTRADDVMCDFDKSHIAALKEDETAKSKRITDQLRAGAITVLQAQTELGYLPDQQANYYLIPSSLRPATPAILAARAAEAIEDPKPAQLPPAAGNGDKDKSAPQVIIIRAEPEHVLTERTTKFLSAAKSVEWEGMMLRREPTDLEKLCIKGIDQEQEKGADSLEAVMLGIRARMVDDAIAALDGLNEADLHTLTVAPTEDDHGMVVALLLGLFLSGAALIVSELNTQGAELSGAQTVNADKETMNALASVLLSRVANDVQSRVVGAAQQALLLGSNVEEYTRAQLLAGSTAYVGRAASEGANVALAKGRMAEMTARQGVFSFLVYSAVLDANTCQPCGNEDGKTGQMDELPPVPNASCPGGAQCRCALIPVFERS